MVKINCVYHNDIYRRYMRMCGRYEPFYEPESTVYHIYDGCAEGEKIHSASRKEGTGNKVLCQSCLQMDVEGRTH